MSTTSAGQPPPRRGPFLASFEFLLGLAAILGLWLSMRSGFWATAIVGLNEDVSVGKPSAPPNLVLFGLYSAAVMMAAAAARRRQVFSRFYKMLLLLWVDLRGG